MRFALLAFVGLLLASPARAQTTFGDSIHIGRANGPITVDGDLSDAGWIGATRIEKWYETNPGDNIDPKVHSLGLLTYDDRYFYAGFEFDDPNPAAIRAPLGDHDNVPSFTDYGGVIIDTRGDGQRAMMMLASPRGIQYDAISDDASGEDPSPDFFWDAAARVTSHGWTLEIRIPFSSLRYRNVDPQTWGILLYRNYPRDFRYQMFSARLPRDSNCFICHRNPLIGIEHLPKGGHVVAAPYVNTNQIIHHTDPTDITTPVVNEPTTAHVGLDLKWTPNADNVADLTVKPDFSQVESDTAQISANERFALFFPEKRPFFLEGIDLFATPVQAVYTRTITAPNWGGRVTGKEAGIRFTALVADDAGGGEAVLPGPNGSTTAPVDFGSHVIVARAKRDIGLSFVSVLVTDREGSGGASSADGNQGQTHNRVVGPDFQWRPSGKDSIVGQWLFSDTRVPNRPDLASAWTGQSMHGHAGVVQWSHNDTHLDWFGMVKDLSDGFRAETGFVPQVGYREESFQPGWTFRPTGFLSRLRTFVNVDNQTEQNGALILREVMPGAGMDTRWNGFMQFRYIDDQVRSGDQVFPRKQFGYILQFSPSQTISQIAVNGMIGSDVDFDNSRAGRGYTINSNATIHPTDHLELAPIESYRWLEVDVSGNSGAGGPGIEAPTGLGVGPQAVINAVPGLYRHLLTARVSRLKTTYSFTPRMFLRVIAQYVSTDRDPTLYITSVNAKDATLSGSVLLAYKLDWQSVFYVGWGDDQQLTAQERLTRLDRQFFVKLSYAFRR
ncbi:MAG TPA: DUF5916 domain-containing protein [Vicinamibacterales bacterium]|nr:DUF5916 domain-containing protein [Vicinamibacterales bacterium]